MRVATNVTATTAHTAEASQTAAWATRREIPAVLIGVATARPVTKEEAAEVAARAETKAKANSQARPARQAKAAAAHHLCRCAGFGTGCEATTVRTFAPGHDAKLGSLLQRAALAGEEVTDTETGTTVPALVAAGWFPFGAKVIARVAAAQAKALAAALSFAGA